MHREILKVHRLMNQEDNLNNVIETLKKTSILVKFFKHMFML